MKDIKKKSSYILEKPKAITPKIDCNQTVAMGLPPAVFLIAVRDLNL
jgi:hypothetical protein